MTTVDEQLEMCLDEATDTLQPFDSRQMALRRALRLVLASERWSLLSFTRLIAYLGSIAQSILDDACDR